MRMARKRGIKVLLDPASSAPLQALTSQQLNQWFELTDVLVPNEQELSVLAPAATFEESLALLGRHIPTVIAKRGADGAYIIEQGQVQHVPSKPVDVIDTVGAGDAFASGLLYGLTQNLNFFDAAVQGVETATLALNTRGAQPANPLS
jgi:fructokinase